MFPGANNSPFQPSMTGQPFRLNQPPPGHGPGMMSGASVNIPTHLPPPGLPVPSPGFMPPAFNAGSSSYPSSMYQSSTAPVPPQYLNQSSENMAGFSGHGQFGPAYNQSGRIDFSGQRKDSVTEMTMDFIKQFDNQVADRKHVDRNPMKVRSKASEQDRRYREDSPFSDVSDTEMTPLTGVGTNKVSNILHGNMQMKGIQGSTPTSQLAVTRNPSKIQNKNPSSAGSRQSSTSAPNSDPTKTSSGLKSILKNYQNEPSSFSTDNKRLSSSGRRELDRSSHQRPESLERFGDRDKDRRTKDCGRDERRDRFEATSTQRQDSMENRDGGRDKQRGRFESTSTQREDRRGNRDGERDEHRGRFESSSTHRQDIRENRDNGRDEKRDHFESTSTHREDRQLHRRGRHFSKSDGLQDVSDSDDDLDVDSEHVQCQVFIGNLPMDVMESDIYGYLIDYPVDVWLGFHKKDRRDICAFLKLPSMKESKKIINDIRDDRYKGRSLDVRFTAAKDFTDYRVMRDKHERRLDPDPVPDREKSFDPISSQQVYYTQVPQYITNTGDIPQYIANQGAVPQYIANQGDVPQYIPNPVDPYAVPVYIMPQSTQQVFIPSAAYGQPFVTENYGAPPQSENYGAPPHSEDYGALPQSEDYYNRDYTEVKDRRAEKFVVFIGNLPQNLSQASLEAFLTSHNFNSVDLKYRDGKAIAFVEFDKFNDAKDMVQDCHNKNCYGRNLMVKFAEEDESDNRHWRERERDNEQERLNKSLFKEYVDSAFANAPILGKKYITEYLSLREKHATYVCSVCMEMSSDSDIAEHVVGYRHRLKCFRKDQPEIYDKLCRIRNKSTMVMECARMAADNEILNEKITIQICMDPEGRGKKHLENIKEASYIGSSKSKSKESSQEKDSSASSSGLDIFKKIAMMKQKFEESKKEADNSGPTSDTMSFDTLASKNKTLAESIVAEIASKQKEEDEIKVVEQTEIEKIKEEDRMMKKMEEKRKEEDMKKRLEEARRKVIENQRKIEEEKKRKEAEKKAEEERRRKLEEDRQRKLEEERIKEAKRQLEEQKRKLEEDRKLLEQKKIEAAQKQALELAKIKALEAIRIKEEEIRRSEEKKKQEEQRVELMLQMLEQQKKLEEARKLEDLRRQEEIRYQEVLRQQEVIRQQDEIQRLKGIRQLEEIKRQETIRKEEEEKQLAEKQNLAMNRPTDLRVEGEKKSPGQALKEQQEREVNKIKNRHMHLQQLQQAEEQRQKDSMAAQRIKASMEKKALKKHPIDHTSTKIYLSYLTKEKIEEIQTNAYIGLPFSMAMKRMSLKRNIGPDDKIGPQENSKIDAVLAMKYNIKGAEFPLIGLEYIVEGYEGKADKVIHHYFCECCCIEAKQTDAAISHLLGFAHRSKYLEIHKPELYANLMAKDLKRATLNELLKKEAMNVERETGRFQIPTLPMFEYKVYSKRMKQVKSNYKDPNPATNIKHVLAMYEKNVNPYGDTSCYDPNLNVRGIVNRVLAMGHEIPYEKGTIWVEFYKYITSKRLNNDPMLGLQYITELRGNKRYAPKYSCSLCDVLTLNTPQEAYQHIQSIPHLEKYLNLVHPQKLQCNQRLFSRGLSKVDEEKIIRDIAYEIGEAQENKESIKVGVLLLQNVWRTWHEQGNPQQCNEFEDCTSARALGLKPEIYHVLKSCKGEPICGLESVTEIQRDNAMTLYHCQLCQVVKIRQNNIIEHLTGKKHKGLYMKKKGLDQCLTSEELSDHLRYTQTADDGEVSVKKVLYLDNFGQSIYSDPEVMKDPNKVDKTLDSIQSLVRTNPVEIITVPDDDSQTDRDNSKQTVTSNTSKLGTETTKIIPPRTPIVTSNTSKSGTKTTKIILPRTSTVTSNTSGTETKRIITPRRPTRFDKIIKGLDYTPLLGVEFMTEVQHENEDVQPKFECKLCRHTGKSSMLNSKTILRHIGTKGHRISFIQRKYPSMFIVIKSLSGPEKEKKLDHYTKEIGSKLSRGQINVKVETDPMYWTSDTNENKQEDDDVIITKVELGVGDQADEPESESLVEAKQSTLSVQQETVESPPKEQPINLDELIAIKDSEAALWKKENEWIQENIQSGQLVASARSSRFVADYMSTFCTYPLVGLQWMTEFHKVGKMARDWWAVCRLCEEKVTNWRFINNHISSIKHRLRYIQKKYPAIFTALKREHFTAATQNLLCTRLYKFSKDIMKSEGKEFKPEVMLQKVLKQKPGKPGKPATVNPISTISSGTRQNPAQSPSIPRKTSTNLAVITSRSVSDNTTVSITQKRCSATDSDSGSVSKKSKTESPGVKESQSKHPGNDTNRDPEAQPETEEGNKILAKSNVAVFKSPEAQPHEDRAGKKGNIDKQTMPEQQMARIPRKSEENQSIRNLKRRVTEDSDIQTKTPDLTGELIDSGEDEDVKIKRSKKDHKARSYRDSYGSSYGQEQRKQPNKTSISTRHSSSSRHRRSSRDRDRSDRSRDRSRKSPSRKDRDKSRSSKPRDKQAEKKTTAKLEATELEYKDESVESGDEDFDAFIMSQLGDDFVTVDEVEDMEDDFMTLDEVGDDNAVDIHVQDVVGESDAEEHSSVKSIQASKGKSDEKSNNLKDSEKSGNKPFVSEVDAIIDRKSDPVSTVISDTMSDKTSDSVSKVEVSVVMDEPKITEKSDMLTKSDGDAVIPGVKVTTSRVETQDSTELTVKTIDRNSLKTGPTICPFLGKPISSSSGLLDKRRLGQENFEEEKQIPQKTSIVVEIGISDKTMDSADVADSDTFQDKDMLGKPDNYSSALSVNETNPDKDYKDIWVIGDSTANRAGIRLSQNGMPDLILPGEVRVIWMVREDMSWLDFHDAVHTIVSQNKYPKIILLHLGANDLGAKSVLSTWNIVRREIGNLSKQFPEVVFLWVDILERINWKTSTDYKNPAAINKKRMRINRMVRNQIDQHPKSEALGVGVSHLTPELFNPDGVNLSDVGLKLYLNSIRNMVLKYL